MDIGALSMVMNQSKLQESAGLSVMKMAMNIGKETANGVTEMLKSAIVDPNLGNHLDTKA